MLNNMLIIKRDTLLHKLLQAQDEGKESVYHELLDVYYKLLEQESIIGNCIETLYYYEYISQNSQKFLTT